MISSSCRVPVIGSSLVSSFGRQSLSHLNHRRKSLLAKPSRLCASSCAVFFFVSCYSTIAAFPTLQRNNKNTSPLNRKSRAIGCDIDFNKNLHSESGLSQSIRTSTSSTTSRNMKIETGFLNAEDAAALDADLMATPGFSLEQLMELAGLSVAQAVYQVLQEVGNTDVEKNGKIVVCCGPGNNGGDGLVAARHLVLFGHNCAVVYPKQSKHPHFINLVQQCEDLGIPIWTDLPSTVSSSHEFSAIVDAVFGFSFHGTPREPFKSILETAIDLQKNHKIPVISVDVPSGWNVDEGDVAGMGFLPDVLISLTVPKLCAKDFPKRHFVGGRFVPPKIAEKYNIKMPPYPGVSQVMEISGSTSAEDVSWEEQYAHYVAEKEALGEVPIAFEGEEWAVEYAKHCAAQEATLKEEEKS